MRTLDSVMEWLEMAVRDKVPIPPTQWIDAAQRLNVLEADEIDKLLEIQQAVAREKVSYIEQGKSASEAKIRVEAGENFKEMSRQRAKIERVQELVRIAKIQGKMRNEEMRGY